MSQIYRAWEADKRERKHRNLDRANAERDCYWTIHTEHHWSREVCGQRLDFWPSTNKFRWEGKNLYGDITSVMNFIHKRERELVDH